MSAPSDILRPADLVEILGLASERAAREWLHREGVPYVWVGRSLVVLRPSLLKWLKEHETADRGDDALTSTSHNFRIDNNIDVH